MTQMTEEEIWQQYPDYDFIEVSNLGRVRTKDRVVRGKDGKEYHVKGIVLKPLLLPNGYIQVRFKANGKQIHLYAHRMVAICYIPNQNNYPQVNHKDNDRTNNVASNLEWCTNQYNQNYRNNFGTSAAELLGRSVIAVNPKTSEVFWFESRYEVERQLGVAHSSVSKVTKGRQNRAGGCWFCDADETAVEKTRAKFGDGIAKKVEKILNDFI